MNLVVIGIVTMMFQEGRAFFHVLKESAFLDFR